MAHFAVIEDGVVTNVILADTLEIAKMVTANKTCIEVPFEPNSPTIGWTHDGENFINPSLVE